MAEKKIKLAVNDVDHEFNVTSENFNRYINDTTPDNKVMPAKQFLRRSQVNKDQRDDLDELCDRGLALNLTAKLIEEFQGDVEIEVKK